MADALGRIVPRLKSGGDFGLSVFAPCAGLVTVKE